ncbi:hypothetical protein EDC01DRAFT_612749 [Geopyxis carbonaria]|nr:hypothetical protein EDC01DRAFT_612749 [Geopyxis carbonaria]
MSTATQQPNISLPEDDISRQYSSGSELVDETFKPKSPGRFTNFFRWGSSSEQGTGSTATSLSDRGPSPSLSPKTGNATLIKSIPPAIDVPRANATQSEALSDSAVSLLPPTPSSFDAIEEEVRAVSADLAASIRREMDLEDLIDRLQSEAAERGGTGRRTSDYFSDAGTPARVLDPSTGQEIDPEKLVRRAEQEKAQLRLEMLGKIQAEREKRRVIEVHVKELEEQLSIPDSTGRIGDLENALDEAKRKLVEERQMKENFEDLLNALKEELEDNRNERDNLRDEVVPQLRARVEGLESEASDLQKLMYEHSRMQQELTNLKNENASLATAIRNQTRQSQPGSPSSYSTPISPPNNVSIPLNPKDRESLAERLKDVEVQRDALHKALKSLRDRQQYESKRAKEKIISLESERDRAITYTPRRQGRDRDVSSLRREVDRLRQRADDALEQKFVCERSLGTLKMDLERAEQETSTLRVLLQEHDNLVNEHNELKDSHLSLSKQAYRDLQQVHERSLARLDELESRGAFLHETTDRETRLSKANEENQRSIQDLRKTLTEVETDRDTAVVEAEAYRQRAESLQKSESEQIKEERSLAKQLRVSTERVEELAAQVRGQLASNEALRDRLADCISRGENEQQMSAKKINNLQGRLKILEDKVLEAQQNAEDAVVQHEEEIRRIKETHTSQLRRLKATTVIPPTFSPKSPISTFLRSPNLEWTSKRISGPDSSTTEVLEKRVSELERALSDADNEMAEVVGRMNIAQMEVLDLQTERDEAVRLTRRLQTALVTQRARYAGLE